MWKPILVLAVILCLAGCAKKPIVLTPQTTAPSVNPAEPANPVTAPSATEPTVTEPPVTEPPVTEPSVTEPPATEPPATEPPVTEPPVEKPEPEPEPEPGEWVELDGKTYYYIEGAPHVGWLELKDERYYFHADGSMARGKVIMEDGEARYFASSGKEVILVNPWNFVPEDYAVELKKVDGYRIAAQSADALKQMLRDCQKAGCPALLSSAYRTHADQVYLFQRRIDRFIAQGYDEETARIEAAKRVAVPGTSEHELGLAVDIVDENYKTMNSKQEETPAQQWLMAHCWEYGFILRYPNEKTDVTGIIYEPWHYRYVGVELALELRDCGLCLEEYFDSLTT